MDTMHLYKRGSTWWVRFRDHQRVERRLRCGGNRRSAEAFTRQVGELVDHMSTGTPLPDDLAKWVCHLVDKRRREKFKAWGLIDSMSLVAGEPLEKRIEAWCDGLRNRGRPEIYCQLRKARAHELLVVACEFKLLRDIEPERVQAELADWKKQAERSDYTRAHYLSAAKAFVRWATRRTGFDPLAILQVSRGKAKKVRRALSDAEQATLVTGTAKLGARLCMTGVQRAMLYRVALGTGLRAGALRRLVVGDIDFEQGVLHARGSGAGNKKSSSKPLPRHMIEPLRQFVAGMAVEEPLFSLPAISHMAHLVQGDARTLEISMDGVDFHALRHTFGTTMARRGAHPKTLMALMDHGTIQMTMRLYVHSFPEDEASAVQSLPDPGAPPAPGQVVAA